MKQYSAQRAIRVGIAAIIRRPSELAGVVHENRPFPMPPDVAVQIHVNYVKSTPDQVAISGAPIDWDTEIEILVKARGTPGADGGSAEDAADALWRGIYERLMADQTIGGLVVYLDPGEVSTQDDELAEDVCALNWRFNVRHSTANRTLEPA